MGATPSTIHVPFRATGRVRIDLPADAPGPASLVLAVHGFGQPVEELLGFARRVAPSSILAAPLGPSAFYRRSYTGGVRRRHVRHGWIAAPDREFDDHRNDDYLVATLDELERRFPLDPRHVAILGYSQGVGVATHFLLEHPDRACALVGLAGGLADAYRATLTRLAGKDVLWISGRQDDAYPPAYTGELVRAWSDAGARLSALELDEGHDLLATAEAPVREWLAKRLSGPDS